MSSFVLTRPTARRLAPSRPVGWLGWLAAALRAIETRRHLAEMDARMLRDIGITHIDAAEEANRAPWDIAPWDIASSGPPASRMRR